MNLRVILQNLPSNPYRTPAFHPWLLGFCLLLPTPQHLFADASYLAPGHPDGIVLLAPPPAPGSAEEAADLASVRAVVQARTPAEKARATKDSTLSFSLFAPVIGPVFEPAALPK